MTKILYIITQGEWGGAQRYVFDLATNLGPGYEVTVTVGEPDGRRDLQERLQPVSHNPYPITHPIKVYQLRHLVRRISLFHDLTAIFELRRLYKNLRPDVIHLNSSKAGIIGSLAGYGLRATCYGKIVYTAHGWVFDEPLPNWRRWLYRVLEKYTTHLKDAIIVLSQHDFQRGKDIKIPKEKMHIVPHGIDANELNLPETARNYLFPFLPLDIQKRLRDRGPGNLIWFGTIAHLYKTKGLDILLTAIKEKRDRLSKALFFIIGDGPERTALEQIVKDCRLENEVLFMGAVSNAATLLRAFDAFVLPSRKEGLPYVLLEAMRARVPIIATRVGGIPELIENKKSGILVKPDSVGELSEALVFAAENPGVMKQCAENAPNPPSLSDMVAKTTSLYRSLWPPRP